MTRDPASLIHHGIPNFLVLFRNRFPVPRVWHTVGVLLVESRLSHMITRKAFQGPMNGRLWCGKVFSGKNRSCSCVSNVPSLSILLWKKSSVTLSKAKAKASIQSFCFVLKLSPSEPIQSATVPSSS